MTTDRLLAIYGRHHSVNTGEATVEWLTSELNLIHAQREKLERELAEAEAKLVRKPKAEKPAPEPGETWLVETALKGGGEPDWVVRSGHGTPEGAQAEVRQLGPRWRRQGLMVRTRHVVGAE